MACPPVPLATARRCCSCASHARMPPAGLHLSLVCPMGHRPAAQRECLGGSRSGHESRTERVHAGGTAQHGGRATSPARWGCLAYSERLLASPRQLLGAEGSSSPRSSWVSGPRRTRELRAPPSIPAVGRNTVSAAAGSRGQPQRPQTLDRSNGACVHPSIASLPPLYFSRSAAGDPSSQKCGSRLVRRVGGAGFGHTSPTPPLHATLRRFIRVCGTPAARHAGHRGVGQLPAGALLLRAVAIARCRLRSACGLPGWQWPLCPPRSAERRGPGGWVACAASCGAGESPVHQSNPLPPGKAHVAPRMYRTHVPSPRSPVPPSPC